jgi:hypothetical protein
MLLEMFKNKNVMILDRNYFEDWMRRVIEHIDRVERKIDTDTPKKPDKANFTIDGERLYDNHDLCFMLNCSKRTLQRFRVSGLLPCRRIRQKTYYLETDVMNFIREHLQVPKCYQKKNGGTTSDNPHEQQP